MAAGAGVSWKDAALGILALVSPIVTGGLWVVRDADIKRFEERCAVVSADIKDIRERKRAIEVQATTALLSIRELSTRFADHHAEAERWKNVIENTRRGVTDLQTKAHSRPDPYTGTDARKRAAVVDKVMQRLEWRVDALEAGRAPPANGNGVKR